MSSDMSIVNIPATVKSDSKEYTVYGIGADESWANVTELTFPSTITEVGAIAIYAKQLQTVNISDIDTFCRIKPFGLYGAFCSDSNSPRFLINGNLVEDLIISDGIESISEQFSYYTYLKSVKFPASLTHIGKYAFYGCSSLSEINIPRTVTSIGRGAFFLCSGVKTLTIPGSIATIPQSAFGIMSELQTLYIEDGVTDIEYGAFSTCMKLTSLRLPETLVTMGDNAFADSRALDKVIMPNSLRTIGIQAFIRAYELTSVRFGTGLTTIGESAFEYNKNIKEVYCPVENLCPALPDNAFETVVYESATLYVPEGMKSQYAEASGWRNFKNIVEKAMSGIDNIADDGIGKTVQGIYNLSGVNMGTTILGNLPEGLYIVLYSDGTTAKRHTTPHQ